MKFLFILILFLSMTSNAKDQAVNILSPDELHDHLSEYIIIDAREDDFKQGHIPKSYSMDWKDLTQSKPGLLHYLTGSVALWGQVITSKSKIENLLSSMQISNDSKVVVVGEPKKWGTEGRIAWNLLYWGLRKVYLLNGGFPAWKKKVFQVAEGQSEALLKNPKIIFKLELDQDRIINKNELAKNTSHYELIDVRSVEEFKGLKMAGQKRAGHLPEAKNRPIDSLYDSQGNFISANQLLDSSRQQVAYCVGGVRSSLYALLFEAYHNKKIRNYDGSIWEWSADKNLPLVK